MKRFLIWLTLIVSIVVVADMLLGLMFDYVMKNIGLKGDYVATEHLLRHYDSDFVVLGSSVALNSINTGTLQDSLGINCYNGASNGQSFPYYLTMLKAIIDQKKPSTVILGFLPNSLSDTGLGSRYNFLAPYYNRGISDIDERMESKGRVERHLLKSNFYRLNTIWFRIFLYNFIAPGVQGENGFIAKPLPPIGAVTEPHVETIQDLVGISPERRTQFMEFISLCKQNGIRLIIVIPPRYIRLDEGCTDPIVEQLKDICRTQGVDFYDDTKLTPFDKDKSLFYDKDHVNINGSVIYTDTILNRLK